jgi:hypothetical protein
MSAPDILETLSLLYQKITVVLRRPFTLLYTQTSPTGSSGNPPGLSFIGWEQVAPQLNYSQDYIYHLHRKALALVRVPSIRLNFFPLPDISLASFLTLMNRAMKILQLVG